MPALSPSQLYQVAPSIFAGAAHERVSQRYGFVPTIEVIEALRGEGWEPVRAQQTRVRDQSRREHTRHLVRFRQLHSPIQLNDALAELVLTNSHDGSSAYQLDVGLFRLICLNGMVTPLGEAGGIRVRHGKRVVDEVIEGSYALLEEVPQLADSVGRLMEIDLKPAEQRLFAESSLHLRYGDDWEAKSPVAAAQLLDARRAEDRGNDLWRCFNRVQENLMKGGLRGRAKTGRRLRTRPICSVTEDLRLNRVLWRMAERFAELKAA